MATDKSFGCRFANTEKCADSCFKCELFHRDYISREAAKTLIHDRAIVMALNNVGFKADASDILEHISKRSMDWIDEVPATDVRPVVIARWEVFTDSSGRDDIRCSSCKQTPHWTVTDIEAAPLYCPNCGAEMRAANDRPYEGRETDSSAG